MITSGSRRANTSMRTSMLGVAPDRSSTAPAMNVSAAATCGTSGAIYVDARTQRSSRGRSSTVSNVSAPMSSGAM